MGRIKPGIIGEVSGKAGDIVFRKINGKIFFSLRPGKYKTGKSKPAKANRTNFGACVKFASFLNKDPLIHKIWEQRKLKGSRSYNRLIKYNSGKFKNALPTLLNIISPPGSPDVINDIIIKEDLITIDINTTASLVKSSGEIWCYLILAFIKERDNQSDYTLSQIKEELKQIAPAKNFHFNLQPNPAQKKLLKTSGRVILYSSIISVTGNGKQLSSSTFAKSFQL